MNKLPSIRDQGEVSTDEINRELDELLNAHQETYQRQYQETPCGVR